jgi:hypothetical protein
MLRLASIFGMNTGVSIVGMVHDALLIEAKETEIKCATRLAEKAMRRASEVILSGFSLQTEAKIIGPRERFQDERGKAMWGWILQALGSLAA